VALVRSSQRLDANLSAWRRVQLLGGAFLLLGSGLLLLRAVLSPDVPFLLQSARAPWIGFPAPPSTDVVLVSDDSRTTAVFRRTFQLASRRGEAQLTLRAFRSHRVAVNGRLVAQERSLSRNWKKSSVIRVAPFLREGTNVIRVVVQNRGGPALLSIDSQGLPERLASSEGWRVSDGSAGFVPARRADDTQAYAEGGAAPDGLDTIARSWKVVLGLFALGLAMGAIAERVASPVIVRQLPRAACWAISAFLLSVFVAKMIRIPVDSGFDALGHLSYVAYLLDNWRIPFTGEGWSMHHPPLFYVLSAAALVASYSLQGGGSVADAMPGLKVIPFLCGLGNVWLSYWLSRRLFADRPLAQFFAVLFAGIVPMNIYMSAYISNESLHAFLSGVAILLTVRFLQRTHHTTGELVVLGASLGLLMLTKATGLLLLCCVLPAVGLKLWLVDRARPGRALLEVGLTALPVLALAGWYYARNFLHFGSPLENIGDVTMGSGGWWQHPGFHTPSYYLHFGRSIVQPVFSGYSSFWDGIYSTFWGDGLVGGQASFSTRHPEWNYAHMAMVYPLAAPALAPMALGFASVAKCAFRSRDVRLGLLLSFLTSFLLVSFLALLFLTMEMPHYAQAKAFFGWGALTPLAVVSAAGLRATLDLFSRPRWWPARGIFYGWAGALVGMIVLSFAA
jgi:hypothetical protein